MKRLFRHSFLPAAFAALFLLPATQAETTDPVGAIAVEILEGTDNYLSIPFNTAPAFQGVISSITSVGSGLYQIEFVNPVESATGNSWADYYYVQLNDGLAQGKYFTISESTDSHIVLDSIGDDLTSVASGDSFSIYEYHTLASIFPPATQSSLVVSTGNLTFQRGSEILIPDLSGNGINRAPAFKYFVTADEWKTASDFSNADNVILYPDTYMIIRQASGAGEKSLVLYGAVPMGNHVINLVQSTVTQDNHVAIRRPIDVRLDELGLGSEFVDSSGNLTFQRGDELLVWENPAGLNPAPDKKFFRVAGEWRNASDFSFSNDYVLSGSSALIIRKKGQGAVATLFWENQPTY